MTFIPGNDGHRTSQQLLGPSPSKFNGKARIGYRNVLQDMPPATLIPLGCSAFILGICKDLFYFYEKQLQSTNNPTYAQTATLLHQNLHPVVIIVHLIVITIPTFFFRLFIFLYTREALRQAVFPGSLHDIAIHTSRSGIFRPSSGPHSLTATVPIIEPNAHS